MSPTYFAPESNLGGGERFAEELSRAMADHPDVAAVKLVSFGPRAFRERPKPRYERVILESWTSKPMVPFSPWLWRELRGADVIHCHQYYVLPTFLAVLLGRLQGSRVFISDLGGGAWTPAFHVDQSRWIAAHLPISQYAAQWIAGKNRRHRVIYAGVDLETRPMRPRLEHDGSAVFLGRILPHKGIHFLTEGLPAGMPLHVVGPPADPAYLESLKVLAAGKDVRFHSALPDAEVTALLQRAMALVHPTPVDAGGAAGVNELFGLALVEAMACGCPVIASRVASLPEIVVPGESGLLVPPNDAAAIGDALGRLAADPGLWQRLALGARERAETAYTWRQVVARCLAAYGGDLQEDAA